ncbi:HK97 family phage prohead protease [Gordonia sp. NPDC003425]
MPSSKQSTDPNVKTDGLAEGEFIGYASVWDVVDSAGDAVQRGAFTKSLTDWAQRGDAIPVYWSHNVADPDYCVGHVLSAVEDDHGLKVHARIDQESPKGRQVYRMLRDRRVGQMSFMYDTVDSERKQDHTVLKELALHEVSVVQLGANRATSIEQVKGRQAEQQVKVGTMPDLKTMKEQRDEAATKAQQIAGNAKAEGVELTAEQATEVKGLLDEVADFDQKIQSRQESADLIAAADALSVSEPTPPAQAGGKAGGRARGKLRLDFGTKSARVIADKIAGPGGIKAPLAAGVAPTATQLVSEKPIELDRQPTALLDALRVVQHPSEVFEYRRQTSRTNNAAAWLPGSGAKPESDMEADAVSNRLEVMANMTPGLNKYDLLSGEVEDWVREELLWGLYRAIEQEVISGSGTRPSITGILNVPGIQSQDYDAAGLVTTTRRALTKLDKAIGRQGVGMWVLSPEDWAELELFRNESGNFDLAHTAGNRADRMLWGRPVTVSDALPDGKGLLMDPEAVVLDTHARGVDVEWTQTHADDFANNQVRLRVEGLFSCSVLRPTRIVEVATAAE